MSPLLAQRYDLLNELGVGGQATTRLALDTTNGQQVVVKQLHLAHLENWKAIELFERECRILKQLDHPAIPSYVDAFHDTPEGGQERFVLVQQYIKGDTLLALIQQGTRFTRDDTIALLTDVLHILVYLHALSPPVIHRDIKPSNLIRRPDGTWTLIDFGAIQAILSEASKLGSTIVGTSGYMAPEQFMGHSAPATDLYALGATLIHMLSHTHPADIALKRLRLDYHAITSCDPALRSLIDDLIAPHIEERPDSASAVLERLTLIDVPALSEKTPAEQAPTTSHNVFPAVAGLMVLLVVAAAAFFAMLSPQQEKARPEDTTFVKPHDLIIEGAKMTQPITLPLSSMNKGKQLQQLAFEHMEFSIESNNSRLDTSQFALTDITPHISSYGNNIHVGLALINKSPLALEELRADVSFVDDDGVIISTSPIDIHQTFQPTNEPGDRMHTDISVPIKPPIKHVTITLHSPKIVPVTPHSSPKTIPIEWLGAKPEGCELIAHVRKDLMAPKPYGDSSRHDLELAVMNTGSCAMQLISLEKRLYDAQDQIVGSQKSYLNATYDPPLRPSEHLLIPLNSYSTGPFEYYKVVVLKADLYDPPNQ